jgi:hypothetical protein
VSAIIAEIENNQMRKATVLVVTVSTWKLAADAALSGTPKSSVKPERTALPVGLSILFSFYSRVPRNRGPGYALLRKKTGMLPGVNTGLGLGSSD